MGTCWYPMGSLGSLKVQWHFEWDGYLLGPASVSGHRDQQLDLRGPNEADHGVRGSDRGRGQGSHQGHLPEDLPAGPDRSPVRPAPAPLAQQMDCKQREVLT